MTLSQMRSKVRLRLNESTTNFYTDADIDAALNEGLAELADRTEFHEKSALIALMAGRIYYNLLTQLPDTLLTPRRAQNTTTSRWLEPTDPKALDNAYSQWESVEGESDRYLIRGLWWFGVFPRPSSDSSGAGVRLYYTAIPDEMTADDDEPPVDVEYQYGIIDFAIYDLMAQQRETQKALGYWQSFQGYVDRLAKRLDGRGSIPRQEVM